MKMIIQQLDLHQVRCSKSSISSDTFKIFTLFIALNQKQYHEPSQKDLYARARITTIIYVVSSDQLAEIRKTTLSKLICSNSQYARRIQPNAFLMPDDLTLIFLFLLFEKF